ncbi:MAG: hypothetical protein QGG79_00755 [Dehalococcoidales bacterium]|jgi:hypothetical protein|nr:hypothetical protein [Dehalococcoidales bacterium]
MKTPRAVGHITLTLLIIYITATIVIIQLLGYPEFIVSGFIALLLSISYLVFLTFMEKNKRFFLKYRLHRPINTVISSFRYTGENQIKRKGNQRVINMSTMSWQ